MEIHTFFLILLIILLAARVLGEFAARLGAPAVIGELCAGVLLGPSLLGWVQPDPVIRLLAEIGIILLLFEVGLETDLIRLARTGIKPFLVATTGVVAPFTGGFALAYWGFDLELLVALFIGGTLTATSIGITIRVLSDLNRQNSHEAQIVLGAAVIDDIIGVILLAMLYEFSKSGGVSIVNSSKVILFVGLFMVLAPIAAALIAYIIKRFEPVSAIPGLLPSTVVSLVLFFAWLAHGVGAPELMGGFAAGLALSRRFALPMGAAMATDPAFAHRVEEQLKPVVHLFTPIFFVMVGLSLDFSVIDWSSSFLWAFSGSLFVLAVVSKLAAGFVINEPRARQLAIGIAMVPRGEVGLIFAELGRSSGVLNPEIYAALILVIALTTLLPPFFMKWLYQRESSLRA